jgi:hypothetical protein
MPRTALPARIGGAQVVPPTAGRIGVRDLPDYVDEPRVDPARKNETYAEFTVTVDN